MAKSLLDGTVYTATTVDGKTAYTSIDDSQFDAATLLSLSYVSSWIKMEIPPKLPLEDAIELAASLLGVDVRDPFPLLIEGTTQEFHMHVINGFCPVANADLETKLQPWRLTKSGAQQITVVGIYAKDKDGVMTHRGSNVHMHGIIEMDGELTSGHLNPVTLQQGATIFIPAE